MNKLLVLTTLLVLIGCGDGAVEERTEPAELNTTGNLTASADTAGDEFLEPGEVGVIAVQGGTPPYEAPFVATGNLEVDGSEGWSGAVTIREAGDSTAVQLALERYSSGGELQATFVRGACGEDGVVEAVVQPTIVIPASGIANYEGRVAMSPEALFDGAHSLKVVPAPAETGPQDAGIVLACGSLPSLPER